MAQEITKKIPINVNEDEDLIPDMPPPETIPDEDIEDIVEEEIIEPEDQFEDVKNRIVCFFLHQIFSTKIT